MDCSKPVAVSAESGVAAPIVVTVAVAAIVAVIAANVFVVAAVD